MIAQSAIDLIIAEEVTSKAYFIKHYTRPEWPGGASGVTIGIGYDLGYATREKVRADWAKHVSPAMLSVMQSCCGVTGGAASSLLRQVKQAIQVGWDPSIDVFMNRDIPAWEQTCLKALGPNFLLMNSTCRGILVSIAYNRGAGGFNSSTDRNREMLAIHNAVKAKNWSVIPALIDSMARLWVGTTVAGVAKRRHREAALFRAGLNLPTPVKDVSAPSIVPDHKDDPSIINPIKDDQPARTPQPATTPAQNGTTAIVIAGGAVATKQASVMGFSTLNLILIAAVFIVAATGIWVTWYRNRNPS